MLGDNIRSQANALCMYLSHKIASFRDGIRSNGKKNSVFCLFFVEKLDVIVFGF